MVCGRAFLFSLLNMLLVLGAIGAGFFAGQQADRYAPRDVIFVAPLAGSGDFRFEEASVLAEGRGQAWAARGDRRASSSLIFSDAEYFSSLYRMNFIEGSAWADGQGVVLSEALAWELFGGGNVTGLSVQIGGDYYTVTGVVRQSDFENIAWLSIEDRAASAFYFRIYPRHPLDARHEVYRLLENRLLANYAVVDVAAYVESIGLRHRVLVYAACLVILLMLARVFPRLAVPLIVVAAVVIVIEAGGISLQTLPLEAELAYGMRQLSRMSRLVNYALLAGGVGLVNLLLNGGQIIGGLKTK